MLLSLTYTTITLFILLELVSNEVHMEDCLLPSQWVRAEVFVV